MKHNFYKNGFSIVEVMLSATLLLVVVACLTGSLIYGQQTTQVAGGIARASFLAQQGLEAARNIRDNSFLSNFIDCPTTCYYGLAVAGGSWVFSGTSDVTDGFVRQIGVLNGSDANRKIVTSTVTWQETVQRAGSVVITTELTNWRAK